MSLHCTMAGRMKAKKRNLWLSMRGVLCLRRMNQDKRRVVCDPLNVAIK